MSSSFLSEVVCGCCCCCVAVSLSEWTLTEEVELEEDVDLVEEEVDVDLVLEEVEVEDEEVVEEVEDDESSKPPRMSPRKLDDEEDEVVVGKRFRLSEVEVAVGVGRLFPLPLPLEPRVVVGVALLLSVDEVPSSPRPPTPMGGALEPLPGPMPLAPSA